MVLKHITHYQTKSNKYRISIFELVNRSGDHLFYIPRFQTKWCASYTLYNVYLQYRISYITYANDFV